MSDITANILGEVEQERDAQDNQWGIQNHEPWFWLAILMEEVGEVATELCDYNIDKKKYEEELIQVAAVAVSMVECSRRNT